MKSEINLMEPELPQLRQMVQKNTERIDRNERLINSMMKGQAEQSDTIKERDEWWENSRREHERDMHDIREILRQTALQQKEGLQKLRETFDETDKRMDDRMEKMAAELRETFDETDKRMDEERRKTDAQIRNISRAFLGSTGHIVEGLMSSSIDKIFKDAGFILFNRGKNIVRGIDAGNKQMELDVLLGNDEITIPVEVKADFTEKKVKRFIHRMTMFREFFPESADKEVVAAVAAINYENGADRLAREEGLLVIRVSSDDIFSLDPFDKTKLRKF